MCDDLESVSFRKCMYKVYVTYLHIQGRESLLHRSVLKVFAGLSDVEYYVTDLATLQDRRLLPMWLTHLSLIS